MVASALFGVPYGAAIGLLGGYLTARTIPGLTSRQVSPVTLAWVLAVVAGELTHWVLMLLSYSAIGGPAAPNWVVGFRVIGGAVTGLLGGWLTLRALRRKP